VIDDVRPAVIPVPDTTNDQVAEAALSRAGSVQVEVRNGSTGAQLSKSTYHSDPFTPAGIITIPDVSGNNLPEIGALGVDDTGMIKLRVADAVTNIGIRNMTYYSSGHDPVDLAAVTDVSGNALADVAVLVQRQSDNRTLVKIKDAASGVTAGTIEFLDAGFTPLGLAVLPDIDNSGSDELVVFATRNSDGRGLVEIREADGSGGSSRLWYLTASFTPLGIAVGDDADNNGVLEIAMLAERNSDQRILVERRNASGPPQTTRHWFFSAGWQAVHFTALSDTNNDALPEYAVLALRNDGRPAVEIRNAGNPKATFRRFFMDAGFDVLQVVDFGDTNGNSVINLGVLGTRQSDGRIKLEFRDARGSANTKKIWFSP
jgi:hypothetical protein